MQTNLRALLSKKRKRGLGKGFRKKSVAVERGNLALESSPGRQIRGKKQGHESRCMLGDLLRRRGDLRNLERNKHKGEKRTLVFFFKKKGVPWKGSSRLQLIRKNQDEGGQRQPLHVRR